MRSWMTPSVLASSILLLGALTSGCKKPVVVADAAPPEPEAAAPVPDAAVDTDATAAVDDAGAADSGVVKAVTAPAALIASGEVYSGNYVCGGTGSLTLRITKVAGNSVTAINEFKHHAGKQGSFNMSGTFTPATRHLSLQAGSWIKQPPGMVTVNLDGALTPDGHTIAGAVVGPGCSSFNVHR
jgi:hypothetical protein